MLVSTVFLDNMFLCLSASTSSLIFLLFLFSHLLDSQTNSLVQFVGFNVNILVIIPIPLYQLYSKCDYHVFLYMQLLYLNNLFSPFPTCETVQLNVLLKCWIARIQNYNNRWQHWHHRELVVAKQRLQLQTNECWWENISMNW